MGKQVNDSRKAIDMTIKLRRCTAVIAGLMVVTAASVIAQTEFKYFGTNGPAFWGQLDPAWTTCGAGQVQSPIDFGKLTVLTKLRREPVPVEYETSTGQIFNNGHTIEIETEGNNVLDLDGVEYELQQFHFHGLSEHTFEGKGGDMELHFVHKSAAGVNAVVGVLLVRGASSGALAPIFAQLQRLQRKTPLDRFLQSRNLSTCQSGLLSIRGISHDAALHRRSSLGRSQGSNNRIHGGPGTVPRAHPLQCTARAAGLSLVLPCS